MRDKDVQKDSMRFRRNLERLGEIFAYEISQTLNPSEKPFVTPLGIANIPTYDDKIVVATILRAGLPLHQGILNYFDDAQNAFVSAYRKTTKMARLR
jgi:uracil phosphoribosyltransferase